MREVGSSTILCSCHVILMLLRHDRQSPLQPQTLADMAMACPMSPSTFSLLVLGLLVWGGFGCCCFLLGRLDGPDQIGTGGGTRSAPPQVKISAFFCQFFLPTKSSNGILAKLGRQKFLTQHFPLGRKSLTTPLFRRRFVPPGLGKGVSDAPSLIPNLDRPCLGHCGTVRCPARVQPPPPGT